MDLSLAERVDMLEGKISMIDYQIKQMMDVMSGTIKALRKVEAILKENPKCSNTTDP